MPRHRPKRQRYLVYSVAMARAQVRLGDLPGVYDRRRAPGGGYVHRFTADDGLNGNAKWAGRLDALIFKSLEAAIACAVVVGEHEGVNGAVVLDAHTSERVY